MTTKMKDEVFAVLLAIVVISVALMLSNTPQQAQSEDISPPNLTISYSELTQINQSEVVLLPLANFTVEYSEPNSLTYLLNYILQSSLENKTLHAQIEELHKQIEELQNRKVYGKTFDSPSDWIRGNQLIVSGGTATIEGIDYIENEFYGDSMMPFVAANDNHSVILLKRLSEQDKNKLTVGDIIIFQGYSNQLRVTAEGTVRSSARIRTMHRIVAINSSADKCFITKGDTYEGADYYCVPFADVEAVVVGVIY